MAIFLTFTYPMVSAPHNPTLLYVTNPMCSWCYGFTPVIRRLQALWQRRLNVKVLLCDLQAYATEPLQQQEKQRLAVSWHRVQERTHLPFDFGFFTRKDFIYKTEPVCRALLSVRLLRPVLTLEVLRAFHSAFYADGLDVTDTAVLLSIVKLFGISENLFLTLFESEEIISQLEEEFRFVYNLQTTNFPSVYIESMHGPELLVKGFAELHELEERLLQRLNEY